MSPDAVSDEIRPHRVFLSEVPECFLKSQTCHSGGDTEALLEPLYAFDPDSISHCFARYRRMMSRTGYVSIKERVIAPVPDKGAGLKEPFIRQSYARAVELIRQIGTVTVIGYSFNPYDGASYARLLDALKQTADRRLVLVSPQAGELVKRISMEYTEIRVHPVEKTFGQWAADSFRVP